MTAQVIQSVGGLTLETLLCSETCNPLLFFDSMSSIVSSKMQKQFIQIEHNLVCEFSHKLIVIQRMIELLFFKRIKHVAPPARAVEANPGGETRPPVTWPRPGHERRPSLHKVTRRNTVCSITLGIGNEGDC